MRGPLERSSPSKVFSCQAQTFSRRRIGSRMRSQLLPELKIDMLSTSIGSCGRRRGRNDFRDFAAFAFRRWIVFMLSDSFQRVKTNRASMPSRMPSNGLSATNHTETPHPAIGWPSFKAIRSALLVLLNVALTPNISRVWRQYFRKCEIAAEQKPAGGSACRPPFRLFFGKRAKRPIRERFVLHSVVRRI